MNTTSTSNLEASLDRITDQGLSTRARFGHVALLLAALTMSTLVASLLATEPALPSRTGLSLAVMLAIGLSWVGYAGWVLRNRWTLLATHRIVAGRMAVAFTAIFAGGALGLGLATGQSALLLAAGLGAIMLVVAVFMLVRAHRRVARLQARRRELERGLTSPGPTSRA
jgi:hypothetical protein